MERIRTRSPVYSRQKSNSNSSSAAPAAPSSPMMSPMHRHIRTASGGGAAVSRRQQNSATRAAMQRLARVMAHQPSNDAGSSSDEDDDGPIPVVEHSTPRRSQRSPSPAVLGRYLAEQTSSVLSTSNVRPSMAVKTSATLIPPIKPSSRALSATLPSESILSNRREKRMSVDLGILNTRETAPARSSSALKDEIDVPQEENENIIEKCSQLRIAEGIYEEAEARVKQLEKQNVSNAALQTRQAMNEEISALRSVTKKASNEAASKAEHIHEGDSEIRSLRTTAQRMMLTQEEMEEVVLKRCWLARYWKLCVQHEILADIAEDKYEYWSSFAPLPLEVVISAGQKARDNCSTADLEEDKLSWDANDVSGEGNIESLLLVEKGLKELASLKVEEAVLVAMAQHRHANVRLGHSFSGPLLQSEVQNPTETFELNQEESDDVLFKQAWLTYFWRRAKNHGLEEDIADERLQFWINQSSHSPTLQDAVDVERGLFELKKLGIEFQLWKAIREENFPDYSHHQRFQTESEL
ncbi:Myc-type basic helix-loop-helix (bHLH) domain-containing protein [Dioscorea alata]|uniref:Myc-type basic helix-loop-helix (BHLH) domain-containing protein n=2 Tax=Dioscorea alata TaxID=55571 RepID=A0ACB7U1U2_DIOAL|nr:Myc-type basic helix-loop-helix (bHLH) domain-containing protein [Dioscorea alata]KAH7654228.1 Myc-type basic helix-loop-helix (bHLH) domain-containing protein [Dioscorea alata]